ncbi:DUF6602 domain-containing protein [uncultured Pseudoteredinibacter sp.]|uniref:DUF6602 domain-containing protein n=1 Tax=uncultured Pseudoteredinibacter sp. TaxID=1641701 RepID=UPI0026045F8C|nr:DUF6602 domain-containing protein [uncultured Pseudoteredinibacter sp.]
MREKRLKSILKINKRKPINNVFSLSEIISDLISVERQKYEEFDYNHNPTWGSMFEALTEESVRRMTHESLDLNLVSGFIYDNSGFRSGEIDRMLTKGKPKRLGFTDSYECHIKDVLVVFEVKKTLAKADLEDACEHLSEVSKAYARRFDSELDNGWIPNISIAAKTYARITGNPEPTEFNEIHRMNKEDAHIFYAVVLDTYSPIKIIHGYAGYKTEHGLRTAFLNFIEDRQEKHGFGIPHLPNLISSEEFSLAKITGMPFHTQRLKSGFWQLIASNRSNPIAIMIEIIWTKISHECNVHMPWGDDMDVDIMAGLLSGKYFIDEETGKEGWQLSSIEPKESTLAEISRQDKWSPQIAPLPVLSILRQISIFGGIEINSDYINQTAQSIKQSPKELVDSLVESSLFSVSESGWLDYIGSSLHVVEINKSECAISNDQGRLRFWCEANNISPHLENYLKI